MTRLRILIIEDEPALTDVLSYNLQREGFETTVAHDGQEGLQKAQMILPDLIVLDLMLPLMNGREVCRELRAGERTKSIPILILTAKTEDQVVGFSFGADDYVTKPFSVKVLVQTIKAILHSQERKTISANTMEHQGVCVDRDQIGFHQP